MDILANFDVINSPDFLTVNPQLELAFGFMKEKYPDKYSKILWAITLDNHPKSIYRNLDLNSRRDLINNEYLSFPLN